MKAREDLQHFAKVLKEWREAQGLDEQEAAEILGVHVVTVRNWERAENKPSFMKIKKVCEALGCKSEELFPKEANTFPEILRKKREEAGLSQQDLSEKIGYHVNTINFWERGQFNPSKFALIDICDFFDLPYDILKKTR